MSGSDRADAAAGAVMCVVGARPNFIKIAPILRALSAHTPPLPAVLVHTGQHYDPGMSERLFADLSLPRPDLNLEVGSASHAVQTAEVMRRFEPALDAHRPRCVIVVGDVNSTLACALVAVKKGIPVVHVEAGLRSFDRAMPEEINRVLTDQIADRLYTTERSAAHNLAREGVAAERVVFVGNVMIDSLLSHQRHAPSAAAVLDRHGFDADLLKSSAGYGVVTLHRPSNVDGPVFLRRVLSTLQLRMRGSLATSRLISALERPSAGPVRKESTASAWEDDFQWEIHLAAFAACSRVRPQVETR